jgi:rhodanese-related sulfurtransferase
MTGLQRSLALLLVLGWTGTASAGLSLWWVEQKVAFRYDVEEVRVETLAGRLKGGGAPPLLFDVRSEEEYAVSRIQGAVRVDPGLSAKAFLGRHGARIRDRDLVFYCSVGERSARLAERVQEPALAAGVLSVANLRGGLFRWYNEGHPVVNAQGETDAVHPYGPDWEHLVEKRGSGD